MIKLLKNRNVLILWVSRALSRFGDAFESLALMYLVYDITGSAVSMGTIMIFSMVPNIIFSPIAGVVADRYSKKVIMFWAEMTRMLCILFIPILMYTGVIQFWHVCIISLGVSIAESFYEPSAGIVFRIIVKDEELPLFNSIVSSTNCIMKMIGYSLSATVMVLMGKEIIFIVDAVTFFLSGVSVLIMNIPKIESNKNKDNKSFYKDFVDGLNYIKTNKFIIYIIFAIFIIDAIGTPVTQFMPVLTEQLLKVDANWAGYLMTISSIGSLIGIVVYPMLVKTKLTLKKALLFGFLLLGVAILCPCIINHVSSGIILFLLIGIIGPILSSWCGNYIQLNCDVNFLGRIASVLNIAILISVPLTGAIVGWSIDLLSLSAIFIITSIISIVSGGVLYIAMNKDSKCKVEQ